MPACFASCLHLSHLIDCLLRNFLTRMPHYLQKKYIETQILIVRQQSCRIHDSRRKSQVINWKTCEMVTQHDHHTSKAAKRGFVICKSLDHIIGNDQGTALMPFAYLKFDSHRSQELDLDHLQPSKQDLKTTLGQWSFQHPQKTVQVSHHPHDAIHHWNPAVYFRKQWQDGSRFSKVIKDTNVSQHCNLELLLCIPKDSA